MVRKRAIKPVLIIEDDAEIRNFVARVLELEGYPVIQADTGEQGLAIARETPLSLVVLDLRLPGRDGWSVLEELKSVPALSAIPVVVLTASAAATRRERALGMGAAAYLVKPLSVSSLRKTVARILFQKG